MPILFSLIAYAKGPRVLQQIGERYRPAAGWCRRGSICGVIIKCTGWRVGGAVARVIFGETRVAQIELAQFAPAAQ